MPNAHSSTQIDSSWKILLPTLCRAVGGALRKPVDLRRDVAHEIWSATKRLGSTAVENVEVGDLPIIRDAIIQGYVDDRNRAVLAALCRGLNARRFFEIGTNRGRTAWTVAQNNPETEIFTLDLPGPDADVAFDLNDSDRAFFDGWASGEAFHGTAEATRITSLTGDSATFDFAPYSGSIDIVYIDGAHSYSYVRNDTEVARKMLAPGGIIVWDDYPAIPGVYRVVNELGDSLGGNLIHILGTRLAVHSQQQLAARREPGARGFDVA